MGGRQTRLARWYRQMRARLNWQAANAGDHAWADFARGPAYLTVLAAIARSCPACSRSTRDGSARGTADCDIPVPSQYLSD